MCVLYIYTYMYATPPPSTLVLLPFGDGKSRISRFKFSTCPQTLISWSPKSSHMSQDDTLNNSPCPTLEIILPRGICCEWGQGSLLQQAGAVRQPAPCDADQPESMYLQPAPWFALGARHLGVGKTQRSFTIKRHSDSDVNWSGPSHGEHRRRNKHMFGHDICVRTVYVNEQAGSLPQVKPHLSASLS